MPQVEYSTSHKAFVKECLKCSIVYVGDDDYDKAITVLSKHFAQDKATRDGLYGRCRGCVSEYQRANRGERRCNPYDMLAAQDHKCGICEKGISFERGAGGKTLAYIDHDHETNEVRGVLCPRCNSLLAIVENFKWLGQALNYLKKYGRTYKHGQDN